MLWPATEGKRLFKTRYEIPFGDRVVEIDVYHDRHEGLVVAEVEFDEEEAAKNFSRRTGWATMSPAILATAINCWHRSTRIRPNFAGAARRLRGHSQEAPKVRRIKARSEASAKLRVTVMQQRSPGEGRRDRGSP